MTTKVLNGGYYAGYTLGAQYAGLIIGATTTVGGEGVVANHAATITNFGQIHEAGYASGIFLAAGGTVINGSTSDATALISGYRRGVSSAGPPGAIRNFATIASAFDGVFLAKGWSLTNGSAQDHVALVAGRGGVYAYDGGDTVANFATISGRYWGVLLDAGGTLTNGSASDAAALVEGNIGVVVYGGASTVTNFGTIDGGAGLSVHFDSAAARLVAEAGSVFLGLAWVNGGNVDVVSGLATFASGVVTYATLAGAGTLALTGGVSVFDAGTRLNVAAIEQTGALTQVDVGVSLLDSRCWTQSAGVISVASGDRLTFSGAGDSFAGTLAGAGEVAFNGGSDIIDGTTLTVANTVIDGASVTLAGAITSTGTLSLSGGTLAGGSKGASLTVDGALVNKSGVVVSVVGVKLTDSGMIEAATGTLDLAAGVSGAGALTIDAGATLELDGAVAKTLTTTFAGAASNLDLATPTTMGATIAGFAAGDTIDLLKFAATSASLNKLDQLIVFNGGARVSTLQLTGAYQGQTFKVASDGAGGTAITMSGAARLPPSFAQAMAVIGGDPPVAPSMASVDPAEASTARLLTPAAH